MSSPSPALVTGVNLNNTLGAILCGGIVGAMLYGVTSMQTIAYYRQNHNDGWVIKTAIPVLWILGTIDMGAIFHFLYYYLITNYGNFASITQERQVWSGLLHIFVIISTQTLVRALFTARIRKLCSNWTPVIAISLLSLLDAASNIALTIKGPQENTKGLATSNDLDPTFNALICLNFASSFAADSLVAICLCYLLQRSRSGYGRTESMINRLTVYIITTGLLTTLVQSAALILFVVSSKTDVYQAVLTQVSKLYMNAYLTMLNDRDRIRKLGGDVISVPASRMPSTVVFARAPLSQEAASSFMVARSSVIMMRSGSDGNNAV